VAPVPSTRSKYRAAASKETFLNKITQIHQGFSAKGESACGRVFPT
jgi:hypothetical protein